MGCHEGHSQTSIDGLNRKWEADRIIAELDDVNFRHLTIKELLFLLEILGYSPQRIGSNRHVSEGDIARLRDIKTRVLRTD